MRLRKALSVRVRNPSRGLVTRMPPEEADLTRPGDTNRTYLDAQNVRFEDGVVCAAQGTSSVQIVTPLLADLISHWRLDEPSGTTRIDSHGDNDLELGTPPTPPPTVSIVGTVEQGIGKIDNAAVFPSVTPSPFFASPYLRNLTPSGGLETLHTDEYSIAGWFKTSDITSVSQVVASWGSALISQENNTLVLSLWDGASYITVTIGTLVADTWAHFAFVFEPGASEVRGYFNGGAAVTATATVSALNGAAEFFFAEMGVEAEFMLDSVSVWGRAISDAEIDLLYNTGDALDYPFLSGPITLIHQGNIIDDNDPKPLTVAAGGKLFEVTRSFENEVFTATLAEIYDGTAPTDEQFAWSAIDFYNKELYAQHDNNVQYWMPAMSSALDLPGLPSADAKWDGVESFFGHVILWKKDRFKWSAQNDSSLWIPVSTTAATFVMTVDSPGFTQPAVNASVVIPTDEDPTAEGVVVGQYIRIDDVQSGITYSNYYLVTAISNTGAPGTITATRLDLTGGTTTGLTVNTGDDIISVDANDSGESQNVGSDINGPIFQILAQGDYAYIFKERSIQSIQFVGLANGIFFVHPEISNEGLLARNCLLGLGDGRMIFVGHREIYSYQGGPTLTNICQQVSRQFYSELDRSRLSEIVMFHKEAANEVWIQYPVVGGHKVLIWNYREDTATIDIYKPELMGITAVADVEWPVDPSWESLAESVTWESFNPLISWSEMAVSDSADRYTLMAFGDGTMAIHGIGFNRGGEAYIALAETQDFDCDEPDIFKYVSTVLIGIHVRSPDVTVRTVYVQLGYRAWLDDDVTWTTPFPIRVQGNYSPPPIRINPGGAGRFLRLRIYSTDADVPWRVTSFEIHCRAGSFY